MLNIVIPMAGRGSRFSQAGYQSPKPFIDIHGKPMIQWVIENLKPHCEHRFILIAQQSHLTQYPLIQYLESLNINYEIITIDGITEGAAETVLKAKSLIDNQHPLMIANSDQYVEVNIDHYLSEAQNSDGFIMTMTADDPKWSYIKMDQNGHICDVIEKEVVSNEATVGIYNFKKGSDFVRGAEKMMAQNLRSKGEFYVAPTYQQLILEGKTMGYYNIGTVGEKMYGLGTPEDLNQFKALEAFKAQVVV